MKSLFLTGVLTLISLDRPGALSPSGFVAGHQGAILVAVAAVLVGVLVVLVRTMARERKRLPPVGKSETRAVGSIRPGLAFIPAGLILLFVLAMVFIVDFRSTGSGQTLVIEVVGSETGWRYHYVGLGIWSDDRLTLPVRRHVRLDFVSEDVIHSFWVPQFGIEQTVIPGVGSSRSLTPIWSGYFRVLSAVDCGMGRHAMSAAIVVIPDTLFDYWAAGARGTPRPHTTRQAVG